jgi:ABC-type Na+ transport system ATPase subunit NatA
MSTTNTKKEIVDYLWEWGELNGEWGKLLVKEVVEKERILTVSERQAIYNLVLIEAGLKKGVATKTTRPVFKPVISDVKLSTLSDVQGVNRLADKQKMAFSPNITVVYGENGTGKTGYGRILKLLGFSYEKGTKLLPNVYKSTKVKQGFTIEYQVDGVTKSPFVWDGTNQAHAKELQGISIFNNNCVRLSLDKNRELLVTPVGFHLFSILSNELKELELIHNKETNSYNTQLSWSEKLAQGTKPYKFISELTYKTTIADLNKIATFSDEDEAALVKAGKDLKKLNKDLIAAQVKELKLQLTEVQKAIPLIEEAQTNLSSAVWEKFQKNSAELTKLGLMKKKGLDEVTKQRGIELFDSDEFQNFIAAADDYISALEKNNYPEKDDVCVYCRQELTDPKAQFLLKTYRELLNDTTEEDIKKLKKELNRVSGIISKLRSDIVFHHPVFGQDDEENPMQPDYLTKYNKSLTALQEVVNGGDNTTIQSKKMDTDFAGVIALLGKQVTTLSASIKEKSEVLGTITEKETKLNEEISELNDRKLLASKKKEVEKVIENLGIVNSLNKKAGGFNTTSVSRKTTEARTSLIAENFNETFQQELKKIRRSHIEVNLDFRTDRGVSKLVQQIQSQYEISEILSEGEQKAIAFAEFLTELKLDNSKAPVIFDDPVTSLDHYIIDEVARRLVKLSEERQVIIFTHSVLLFNSIKQKSELPLFKRLQFKYYETEKDLDFTGYLYDSPDLKQDTFPNYEKKINVLLGLPKEERSRRENELAVEGYNKLRAAIEVLVEKEILHDIVKRYRKNVALTSLEKINGGLIEKHKEDLNVVFERCCGYIDAHSDPDPLVQSPSLDGLKLDLTEVQRIRKEFLPGGN